MGEGMGGPGPEQMMTPMERISAAKEYGKEMDKVTSVGDALSAVAITEGMTKIVEAYIKKILIVAWRTKSDEKSTILLVDRVAKGLQICMPLLKTKTAHL